MNLRVQTGADRVKGLPTCPSLSSGPGEDLSLYPPATPTSTSDLTVDHPPKSDQEPFLNLCLSFSLSPLPGFPPETVLAFPFETYTQLHTHPSTHHTVRPLSLHPHWLLLNGIRRSLVKPRLKTVVVSVNRLVYAETEEREETGVTRKGEGGGGPGSRVEEVKGFRTLTPGGVLWTRWGTRV